MTLARAPEAPEALYNGHSLRRCKDCDRPVPRFDQVCAIDRARRRAITFLRQAHKAAEPLGPAVLRRIHDAELGLLARHPK